MGQKVKLDASKTHDPDGNALTFNWFHYEEAGATGASLAAITVDGAATAKAAVTATATCRPMWLPMAAHCPDTGTAHLILAVTDNGSPALTSYRRIVLSVRR